MNKRKPLRATFFLLPAIALCLSTLPTSAQRSSKELTLENIGKENPFEVVRPVAGAKNNLMSGTLRPSNAASEQVVEIKPDMYMQVVMLKFLEAASIEPVASNLLSAYGEISIDTATNSIIICDTADKVKMIVAEIRKVDIIPDMYMQVVMLKFLQADSIEPVASKLSSPYGKISIDADTNSIIICDTPDKVKKIITRIREIDKTPQQVMIEVVILDVKLQDDTEIGVNWEHITGRGNTENYTQSLAATVATSSGMDFSFLHDGINVTIHALQQVRDVKILASPKIMVLSGEEATIETIEEIPYIELGDSTEGSAQFTTTEFKEVGVKLTVTALITDEQKIRLTVAPEQSIDTGRFGKSNTDIPIIDIRKATTVLLMEDGQVVVLGGLRRKDLKNSIDKIPLLGDLPLVGFLFSKDQIEIEHTELVVFISPHIYKGEPLTEREMGQFNELRNSPPPEFQEHKRPEFEFIEDVFGLINETADIYP